LPGRYKLKKRKTPAEISAGVFFWGAINLSPLLRGRLLRQTDLLFMKARPEPLFKYFSKAKALYLS
jgi:hypothetical protein